MNAVATVAQMAVKAPVPMTMYAQGDQLFVHNGADYRVVGRVGNFGSMAVSSSYPQNAFPAKSMDWLNDRAGVATYVATAINAYPGLCRRVKAAESLNAEMAAKLAVAAAALKRSALSPEYAASLARELELCAAKAKA
ncbi:hypothetical protein [Paracidovorax wautersii]|uniref:Uncharacterized protein n=1 Tax=Paracidovorax wautersii TaxID=1177982 RepID=A0A1I2HXS0_9BURK|nr:hypothetical protein [Paracidovorax wautersii]SFF34253.1 hypothetical protein SAMN04489711_1423 [Paracidovorax wautersii]